MMPTITLAFVSCSAMAEKLLLQRIMAAGIIRIADLPEDCESMSVAMHPVLRLFHAAAWHNVLRGDLQVRRKIL